MYDVTIFSYVSSCVCVCVCVCFQRKKWNLRRRRCRRCENLGERDGEGVIGGGSMMGSGLTRESD